MAQPDDLRYLRVALMLAGSIFLAGVYPPMIIWPSGWTWEKRNALVSCLTNIFISSSARVVILSAAKNPGFHQKTQAFRDSSLRQASL